ncbi:MAG TPA: hypothetical protein VGO11_17135 [Chthoniobacteraceae bacterium]|jgi:hypothetical protein|nr:hypothetical protein [Chthoniobacteraceae bacterium]
MSTGYYPDPNDRRADWWVTIRDNQPALSQFLSPTEMNIVARDADWAIYVYRTVREAFDEMQGAILTYCDVATDAPDGSPAPTPPAIPAWPAPPTSPLVPGIEARRILWVARARAASNYTPVAGALLGLEAPDSTFNPATYQAEIFGLSSAAARTVAGKFRKARGNIDGINLYGRKEGTMTWILLGRFTASPFTATIPLAGAAPRALGIPRPRGEARRGDRGRERCGAGDCAGVVGC